MSSEEDDQQHQQEQSDYESDAQQNESSDEEWDDSSSKKKKAAAKPKTIKGASKPKAPTKSEKKVKEPKVKKVKPAKEPAFPLKYEKQKYCVKSDERGGHKVPINPKTNRPYDVLLVRGDDSCGQWGAITITYRRNGTHYVFWYEQTECKEPHWFSSKFKTFDEAYAHADSLAKSYTNYSFAELLENGPTLPEPEDYNEETYRFEDFCSINGQGFR